MSSDPSTRPGLWAPLAVVVGSAAAIAGTRLGDPDLGFHLATGREVLATGHIPATNVLSFAQPDHPWLVHEWLPAALFELVHQVAGAPGLVGLQVILVVACWTLVFLAARRESQTGWPAALATVLALAAAGSRINLRPHLFTALFLAALVWLTSRSSTRASRWASIGAMGAVLVVGYQMHAGALFLLLFLVAVAAGRLIDARWRGSPDGSWIDAAVAAAGGLGVSALALAIYHPYGLEVLLVPLQLAGSADLTKHVIEYRAIWHFPLGRLPFFWVFLACVVPAVVWGARRVPTRLVLATAGMLFMAVRHVRVIDSAAIVAAPLLALALATLLTRASDSVRRLLPVLAVLVGVAAALVRWGHTPPGLSFDPAVFATRPFDYLDARQIQGRAYMSNGWAGPYLGRYYPTRRVFFDPRFEAYSAEFVELYKEIRYGAKGWAERLDAYEIEVVVLKYTSPGEAALQDHRANLRQLLVASPDWMLVYFDHDGEIFLRVRGANAEVARRDGIPNVEPDGIQFLGDPAAALPDLQRALKTSGPSARLFRMLAASATAAGEEELASTYEQQASRLR